MVLKYATEGFFVKTQGVNSGHDWMGLQETNDCLIVINGTDQVVFYNDKALQVLLIANFDIAAPPSSSLNCLFMTIDQRIVPLSEFKYFVGKEIDLLLQPNSGSAYKVNVSVTGLRLLGQLYYSVMIRQENFNEAVSEEVSDSNLHVGNIYERNRIAQALSEDLKNHRLAIHYQPQLNIQDNSLYGVESLARWHSTEFGPVAPDYFIALAEEFGLINELDLWVLRQTCLQLSLWRKKNINIPIVSVNLSPITLQNPNLSHIISGFLKESRLSPSDLMIEVIESKQINKTNLTMSVLNDIHKMGVGFSLDDFGTGYSSLKRLLRLPVSQLKLDRCFVNSLADNIAKGLSEVVFDVSKKMGFSLIAEGVEDTVQYELLKSMGYTIFQGYLFSPPLSVTDFETWVCSRGKRVFV